MLERRASVASLGLLLTALLPATAAADFVPCASGGTASCVFGPTAAMPQLVPGGVDSAYVPCSDGRFVVGAVGSSSNMGLRQVANEVLGLTNYRAVPGGVTMPSSGGAMLPMAVAANARSIYTLSALVSGAYSGLQLLVSPTGGSLSFAPEPRLTMIDNAGQGDLDCAPQGNVCVLAATQALRAPTGAYYSTAVFAQWASSMSATPPLIPLSAPAGAYLGGSPMELGRPAVVFEPVMGRFWIATYVSSMDGTPSLFVLDATPGAMPSVPYRPTPAGSAPTGTAALTQRRNVLAPDGAGGVWWAWETEPGAGGTTSPIQLFRCAASGVTVSCSQDLSWQAAASGLHNMRLPSLAFDGRRLFFAMESHPTTFSSLVGYVVLDSRTNVWSAPPSGWPVDGAGSPSLAADTHGNVVLNWVVNATGAVNTATFRTGCASTDPCPASTTCQPVPSGGASSCVLSPGECTMPDAGDAMADAADASDSAADSGADVPGDLADAGAMDSTAADTQSAEAAMSADSASMEASPDGATGSDGAANGDSASRTMTGGSFQCAAPVGPARGRGGSAALALGALGLALARRKRR